MTSSVWWTSWMAMLYLSVPHILYFLLYSSISWQIWPNVSFKVRTPKDHLNWSHLTARAQFNMLHKGVCSPHISQRHSQCLTDLFPSDFRPSLWEEINTKLTEMINRDDVWIVRLFMARETFAKYSNRWQKSNFLSQTISHEYLTY